MKRDHSEMHLAYIRMLPCVACGYTPAGTAAHVRMAAPGLGKRATGKGEKPDDAWTVPLCDGCHLSGPDAQHRSNEAAWWAARNINPAALALELWAVTGDVTSGRSIVFRAHMRNPI